MSAPGAGVLLQGGLGNQIFQAAAALALARRHGGDLVFDVSKLERSGFRPYALGPFPHGARLSDARPGGLARVAAKLGLGGADARFRPPGWPGAVLREAGFGYDPAFADAKAGTFLVGDFQSWRYVEPVAEEIARVFDPRPHVSAEGARRLADLRAVPTVALHVRLGDYVTSDAAAAKHGVLDPGHYRDALARIDAAAPGLRRLLLSDEPEKAAARLDSLGPFEIVRGTTALDDMALIASAEHRVIANSSFSWWGAWHARGRGTTVAPGRWFADPAFGGRGLDDLLPPDWVRV